MNGIKTFGLACILCVCAQAADVTCTTEAGARAAFERAVYTLDVAKVTSLSRELEAAHVHVDLAPLLEKLSVAKPLARRWPAKIGAVVGGFLVFSVFSLLVDHVEDFFVDKTCRWIVLAGSSFGAYTCYKAYIRARIRRARTIVDVLLANPAIEVGDVAAARKALFDLALLGDFASEEMARLCGAIDARISRKR